MTDLLKKAIKSAVCDVDIKDDDQLVLDWMDDKVYRLELVEEIFKASPESLPLGQFDEVQGGYPIHLETCTFGKDLNEVHIYRGLERMARAYSQIIIKEEFIPDKTDIYYFMYKGIKFYELTDKDKPLK